MSRIKFDMKLGVDANSTGSSEEFRSVDAAGEALWKMTMSGSSAMESSALKKLLPKIREGTPSEFPSSWAGGFGQKALRWMLPESCEPNSKTTVIGGICSLFTGDSERIRTQKVTFQNTAEFETWFRGWYPRFDQVHDAVGVPPKSIKNLVYVCEDSLFASRIEKWTGLPAQGVSEVIRNAHAELAHPIIKSWLVANGYEGSSKVVYTSDLERPLNLALRVWERENATRIKPGQRESYKVNLMYTSLWLDVLEIDGKAVIYEPVNHALEGHDCWDNRTRFEINRYGEGINSNLGFIGFVPFADVHGYTRTLPFDSVPNRGNVQEFMIKPEDLPWYALNFTTRLGRNPPTSPWELQKLISKELLRHYQRNEITNYSI